VAGRRGAAVVCEFYRATFEGGEVVDDPSEDRLFIMLGRLELPDNSNIVIEPCGKVKEWYVVIALTDDSGYEIEFRDPDFREHDIQNMGSKSQVARQVTIWLAGRGSLASRTARYPLSFTPATAGWG
jgi:hypothetical protein